ncbi:hypothetical protein BpHYR1_018686 [Brachionus plicatilis]|uniref:Uncharacterized protein n=1 Tax=Brachionus plicatilis TaxID=10195 RepID=A0A3M7S5E6_BRAPC|nr:hypothetical protein BpHYR1_018686 [Brachionus plicatilis]
MLEKTIVFKQTLEIPMTTVRNYSNVNNCFDNKSRHRKYYFEKPSSSAHTFKTSDNSLTHSEWWLISAGLIVTCFIELHNPDKTQCWC